MKYSYEYLTSIYTGANTILPFSGELARSGKIKVECKVHGIFEQAVSSIINGRGCQKCYFESKKGQLKYTSEDWITRAQLVHGGRYTYDRAVYTGAESPITITCPTHGDFVQSAMVHLSGHGCRQCSTDKMISERSYDTARFIETATAKHNSRYSYDRAVFTGIRDKITVTCPEHGDFNQVAYYHTYGNGCPACGKEHTTYKSIPEYEIIDFLKTLGVTNIKHSSRFLGFELDIFLPDYNIAIEYDGLYWHSSNRLDTDKSLSLYHLNKTLKCESQGIRLFHIFENEWLDDTKREIWKSVLTNSLKLSNRIFARKCCIKTITSREAREFCDINHLQGGVGSAYSYGLFYNNMLVSVIALGRSRYGSKCMEILRYCNNKGYTTVGGFSKLISYVLSVHNTDLISYANRRWSNGNLYKQSGFKLTHTSGPCYFYIDKKFRVYHRSSFTKKHVLKMFPGATGTEVSIMYDNGYRRIWDCGNHVFTIGVGDKKKSNNKDTSCD